MLTNDQNSKLGILADRPLWRSRACERKSDINHRVASLTSLFLVLGMSSCGELPFDEDQQDPPITVTAANESPTVTSANDEDSLEETSATESAESESPTVTSANDEDSLEETSTTESAGTEEESTGDVDSEGTGPGLCDNIGEFEGQPEGPNITIPGRVMISWNEDLSGVISVHAREDDYNKTIYYSAQAKFYAVYVPGVVVDCGQIIQAKNGPDSCSLIWRIIRDEVTKKGEVEYLNAGDLVIESGPINEPLKPSFSSTVHSVSLREYEPRWNTPHSIRASGGTFPSFNAVDSMVLPARIDLIAPKNDQVLESGAALPVSWTPGEIDKVVELSMEALSDWNINGFQYNINCTMTDDGEFTIPASLMEFLPPGWLLDTLLYRSNEREITIESGEILRSRSTAARKLRLIMEE